MSTGWIAGILLAFGVGAYGFQAAPAVDRAELAQRVNTYLEPYERAGHLSGVLMIARGPELIVERAFGLANRELGVPNTRDMRFNVASITKPVTQIIGVKLLEQRRLALSDKLSKWIPEFPNGDRITVEHLWRHRAGIPHRVTELEDEVRPMSPAQVAALAAKKRLQFEPGAREEYSSGGYTVLTRVLELASGKNYPELLQEHVFGPAGMTRTAHVSSIEMLPDRAAPFGFGPRGFENARLMDYSHLAGAGSLYSTAPDLLALMRAVVDGKFGANVKASLMREAGLDWNGLVNQFRAFARYDKAGDFYIVYTANLFSGAADRMRQDLHKLLRGEAVPPPPRFPPQPAAVPATELRSWEGVYDMNGAALTVREEQGFLRVNDRLLTPTGPDSFFCPQDYGTVKFSKDESGKPSGMDWTTGGVVTRITRKP
ncbi:MAG: beta-lactamase family protein [Bryobacteraceae bacterium]|nr:beta-lactamase family protein [Bryobacteraceae bacterium]